MKAKLMSSIINFSGDTAFSHFERDDVKFCNEAARTLKKGHFNVCNLENPICVGDLKQKPKPIILRSRELPGIILKSFDAFSLANNHIFDCHSEGFLQTLRYLDQNNKKYFGAGLNQGEAEKPFIIELNSISIVIWGITRFENAKKKKPGTAGDEIKHYKKEIKREKEKGSFIIFFAHWGREYVDLPTPDDKNLAKSLIDCGVDCIIGSHPHVAQGAEIYKGKYIFYSLGNFIFNDKISHSVAFNKEDPRINLGYIVQLQVENDLSYTPIVIPYKTHNGVVSALAGAELSNFKNHFVNISLQTYDNKVHVKEFYKAASDIRKQSIRMIKKQMTEHGMLSLIEQIKNLRLQDLRIAFYPNLEKKFKILAKDNLFSKGYSVFVHKFLTFSLIGILVVLTSMLTLGLLLGVLKLPLFPTWWLVYLASISLSLFLNNKLIFKGHITVKKTVLFFICYLSSMFLGIYLLKFFRLITDLPNWLLGYLVLPFTLTYNFFVLSSILHKGNESKKEDKIEIEALLNSLIKENSNVSKG